MDGSINTYGKSLWCEGFSILGAALAWRAVKESTYRMVNETPMTQDNQPALSSFLSKENAERLALGLCVMRGTALKVVKMLSIHDESCFCSDKYQIQTIIALWKLKLCGNSFEIKEIVEKIFVKSKRSSSLS
ncbi:unnamed protein product [Arabidopsis lyrata]|uniref:Uncharacterized protein n=1 Tax=Arabidopsis lyrata subsp. lyrata TaxID=81972 RepID=D7M677_ARALL|nr:protein ABC transporter 1, mitochondrial [Arabidopsis lyrata subsp. lyrata]EFH50654.1 hypothetical protein ARALYDRAFT_910871 [Arabidopsis lyrata subsp. lyrata]CAH8272461.1 unnamed protein product [Arabidopsis lyrata]|eukprot:XP_002874395.1 protein ABC transporter 1, mitochondrial [Arabidopsis lyrata subsp. lyrata]